MARTSIKSKFWESLRAQRGLLSLVVGPLLSFLLWYAPPVQPIPIWIPIGILWVSIVLALVAVDVARQGWKEYDNAITEHPSIPRVVQGKKSYGAYSEYSAILVLEQSRWFRQSELVTICLMESECERFLTVGLVLSLQANGLVQIGAYQNPHEGDNPIWNNIISDSKHELAKIIVKPSISSQDFLKVRFAIEEQHELQSSQNH